MDKDLRLYENTKYRYESFEKKSIIIDVNVESNFCEYSCNMHRLDPLMILRIIIHILKILKIY